MLKAAFVADLDSVSPLNRRCGEMGRSPARLLGDLLCGREDAELVQALNKRIVFTQSGRSAILLAARLWNIGDTGRGVGPLVQLWI